MINQDALACSAGILKCPREYIFTRVIRGLNRLFSPRVYGFIGLLCGLTIIPLGIATAVPLPPVLCIEGATDCGAVSLPSSEPKRWNPGHYMQFQVWDSSTDEKKQKKRFRAYDSISNNTQIKGVALRIRWGQLESSKGVYTFDFLNEEIEKLQSLAVPKQLFIRLIDRAFSKKSGPNCINDGYFPAYIIDIACTETSKGNTARIWDPAVVDRMIALYQAIAAEWDDNPAFEGIYLIRETAKNGAILDDPTFSYQAYKQGLKNLVDAADTAFVKSNAVLSMNFSRQQDAEDMFSHLITTKVGYGGPDTMPDDTCAHWQIRSDKVYNGTLGDKDHRGAIPSIRSNEGSQMGGGTGNCVPDEIRDWANDQLHASHLMWTRQNYRGTPEQQWNTGVLPYINNPANDLTHTSCPTNYTQGCVSN